MTTKQIKDRLEYLRQEIEAERLSYGEIAELQSLIEYIDPSDTLLLEWAGVPEYCECEEDIPCEKCRIANKQLANRKHDWQLEPCESEECKQQQAHCDSGAFRDCDGGIIE